MEIQQVFQSYADRPTDTPSSLCVHFMCFVETGHTYDQQIWCHL